MKAEDIEVAALIDLERLVNDLRAAAEERASIPVKSGSVSKEIRKERRAKRTALARIIREREREIVSWALSIVPIPVETE